MFVGIDQNNSVLCQAVKNICLLDQSLIKYHSKIRAVNIASVQNYIRRYPQKRLDGRTRAFYTERRKRLHFLIFAVAENFRKNFKCSNHSLPASRVTSDFKNTGYVHIKRLFDDNYFF